MAAPAVRRAPAPATQAPTGFNFGDPNAYSTGGGLPEGDYCWKDLTIMMHQYTKADGTPGKGAPNLGVMITMVSLADAAEYQQFYGFGRKAHESWAPNPETGKGIVPIPGGPGIAPNNMTKWAVLHKSLMDSGLPQGILNDDMSVLEGMWVHMANQPEPVEWATFGQSKTGEAAEERKAGVVAVVTEIKDDGKPWEGTGGIPAANPTPVGKVAARAAATRLPGRVPAAAPIQAASASPSEDVESAAISAISDVLMPFAENGKVCTKLLLRTGAFKAVNTTKGQDTASKVINTYFGSDEALNGLLSQLGYKVVGPNVVAA